MFAAQQGEQMTVNRDHQHGGMEAVGRLAQALKSTMRIADNWYQMTPGHREALDMIAHKIARILSGADPHDREHWEDVAGYAQAAMRLTEADPKNMSLLTKEQTE